MSEILLQSVRRTKIYFFIEKFLPSSNKREGHGYIINANICNHCNVLKWRRKIIIFCPICRKRKISEVAAVKIPFFASSPTFAHLLTTKILFHLVTKQFNKNSTISTISKGTSQLIRINQTVIYFSLGIRDLTHAI